MNKLVINSYDEFASHLGKELGTSEWLKVDQDRINQFADATLDHQWIHVDVQRAKEESPYKSTIAHGYLTLSLLPYMWNQIIDVRNLKMMVNYGMDKMRFGRPVITGSSIRLVTSLNAIENLRGVCRARIGFKIEIENERKPALLLLVFIILLLKVSNVLCEKYSHSSHLLYSLSSPQWLRLSFALDYFYTKN